MYAVLDGFERRCRMGMFDHYLAEYIWRRSHGHSLSDKAFKAFLKIYCHAVPFTRKRSAVRKSKKIVLIQLARDLDESPDPSMSKIVLRNLIISSKYYKEEEAKELLEVITAERLETEQQQKLEQQEQLSIEKLRLEMELSRIANQSATQNNGQTSRVKSLDEIVKMVRLLTVKVPNKSDGWEYFFSSLEKAFASEMVSDELKPKVLLCMLGDKVSNLLVNLGEEELKDYESLKQVVLKEYEPSPQKYV
ncbi:retrovirus-related Pol polyprotein from transposon opus [Trichonephila clavipes]|nr:retrovirus-related Pol polyprotein from transposon opus [Trichonephila clavipes]